MDAAALVGQKQAVDATVGAALEQAAALHLVEQLAHVALGDQ